MKRINKAIVFGMFIVTAVVSAHADNFSGYHSIEELERDVRGFCRETQVMLDYLNEQREFHGQVEGTVQRFCDRFIGDINKAYHGQFSPLDAQEFQNDAQCLRLLGQLKVSPDSGDRATAREIAKGMIRSVDKAYYRITGSAFTAYFCPRNNPAALAAWRYCNGIHRFASQF